jgi:hypothetical protein
MKSSWRLSLLIKILQVELHVLSWRAARRLTLFSYVVRYYPRNTASLGGGGVSVQILEWQTDVLRHYFKLLRKITSMQAVISSPSLCVSSQGIAKRNYDCVIGCKLKLV